MLADLINQYAADEANAGDWQGVVDKLNTPSIVVLNDKHWTLGMIQLELGVDTARTVAAGLKGVGEVDPIVGSAYIAMSTVGLQLHTDERQALVDTVGQAAGWSSDLIASLKELGKKLISPAANSNLAPVTAEQCQADWEAWKQSEADGLARQKVREALYGPGWNQHIAPVLDGDASMATIANLVAGLRALANELEAG